MSTIVTAVTVWGAGQRCAQGLEAENSIMLLESCRAMPVPTNSLPYQTLNEAYCRPWMRQNVPKDNPFSHTRTSPHQSPRFWLLASGFWLLRLLVLSGGSPAALHPSAAHPHPIPTPALLSQ